MTAYGPPGARIEAPIEQVPEPPVPDGATEYKCAPPIRERVNRERLWKGLGDGVVTQVVTDHSPSPSALKCVDSGDFTRAWGGIASLELGLEATWTEASARGFELSSLVEWMCGATARLVGLDGGVAAPGGPRAREVI